MISSGARDRQQQQQNHNDNQSNKHHNSRRFARRSNRARSGKVGDAIFDDLRWIGAATAGKRAEEDQATAKTWQAKKGSEVKMKNTIITITGRVSSCKTPIASKIKKACESKGVSCEVNDHKLFAFELEFNSKYEEAFKEAASSSSDVVVLVVGAGNDSGVPFKIEVEPAIPGAAMLFRLFSDPA
jgi:hypothetical protein